MTTDKTLDQICIEIESERHEAIEKLTIQQFKEAIRQMIACGDFQRHVWIEQGTEVAQQVCYIPAQQVERLKSQVAELQEYKDANEKMIDRASHIVPPSCGDEGFATILTDEQIKEAKAGGE